MPQNANDRPSATRRDLIEGYQAWFRGQDGDGDGRLSRDEWGRSVDAAIAEGKTDPMPLGNEDQLRQWLMSDFKQFDSNGDGFVTVEEMLAPPLRTFVCADADADGSLSPAEQRTVIERCSETMPDPGS